MRQLIGALALATALSVSAPAFAADTFPVIIEHALGSTTIEAKPERVVTWGWSAQDVAQGIPEKVLKRAAENVSSPGPKRPLPIMALPRPPSCQTSPNRRSKPSRLWRPT